MSEGRFDFHVHSSASDGTLPPEQVAERARRAGVELFALTDHDSTEGVAAARVRGAELGIEVWGGIELSVHEDGGSRQLHLLGLGIEPDAAALRELCDARRAFREDRGRRIVSRLADVGVRVSHERVRELAGSGVLGRPHVARALVEAGHCGSVDEAFGRWLRRGRPAYEPSGGLGAAEAIAAVHAAGGVAALAHPTRSVGVDAAGGLDGFVARLVPLGLDALEVEHPRLRASERKRIRRLARRYGLLESGGSDFHGDEHPPVELGRGRDNVRVGRDVYAALAERRARVRAAGATAAG